MEFLKRHKWKSLLVGLLTLATVAYAAGYERIPKNLILLGTGTSTPKTIEFDVGLGAANPKVRGNSASPSLEFASDGSSFVPFGSGGGGTLNLVINPSATGSATTGVTNGTSHTTARVSGANSPLNIAIPTAFEITASAIEAESAISGHYHTFTVPSALRNTKLRVGFSYTVQASQTWSVSVRNAAGRLVLNTDASGASILANSTASVTGNFSAAFDSDSGTGNYTVHITRTAGSGTAILYATNIAVDAGAIINAPAVGTRTAWTPNASVNQGFGTVGVSELWYQRIGDSMLISGYFTPGTITAVEARLAIPSGFTLGSPLQSVTVVGKWIRNTGAGSTVKQGVVLAAAGENFFRFSIDDTLAASNPLNSQTANVMFTNNQIVNFINVVVPIAEWSGAPNYAGQNDVEYASNSSAFDSSDTTSFQYGPNGAAGINTSLGADRNKTVRFLTPFQAGETPQLQYLSSGVWINQSESNSPWTTAPAVGFGALTIPQANGTDVIIQFYRFAVAGTTYNSLTGALGWDVAQPGTRWRVVKSRAGVAIGFGLANATSSGLVGTGAQEFSGVKKFSHVPAVVEVTTVRTAASGDEVILKTGAGIQTLPASPAVGDKVVFRDGGIGFTANNVTVARNSQLINGAASDFILGVSNARVEFVFVGGSRGWQNAANVTGTFGDSLLVSQNMSVRTWTSRNSAIDNNWFSVAWSPELSLFVAVSTTGTGNRVMTSPNGTTWTSRNSAADNDWRSVVWSPQLSLFVAVSGSGAGNRVMTSPNGIAWTSRNSAADHEWLSVAWSPELSLFVAVSITGTGNRVMTSQDGTTWTSRNSATDNNWFSVAWSPELSLFVAVSTTGTGNRVMTSPNGTTWTSRNSAADNDWRSVVWSPQLSLFVAVSATGTGDRVMTSPNGITWTSRTSAANNTWISVVWSPELSLFVAVSASGIGNRVMTSPNGTTWTSRTSAADNDWISVVWSPELSLFVAVSGTGTGNRVMTSL